MAVKPAKLFCSAAFAFSAPPFFCGVCSRKASTKAGEAEWKGSTSGDCHIVKTPARKLWKTAAWCYHCILWSGFASTLLEAYSETRWTPNNDGFIVFPITE